MAALGTSVASGSVCVSMRTFTNWLGKSALLSFANSAFILTVPVATSIVLSAVTSLPVASLTFWSRSHASTGDASPDCSRFNASCTLSSGIGNTTLIGCSCAMITMPFASDACTTLPGSTCRRPTRPESGAVTRA